MRCAWDAFIGLLPPWMRSQVDRQGSDTLQELRLRLGQAPELVLGETSCFLERTVTRDDLAFCVNTASRYSPWSAATASLGYITATGGHRVGLCGETVLQNGTMTGVRTPTSLCLRVARDFPGIAARVPKTGSSMLILGKPGSGKTTLLRDLVRQRSETLPGSIAVVDERGEVFPKESDAYCFQPGRRTDVLTGCPKAQGIEMVLRTMGPSCIAVDEITARADCDALLRAGWCGVTLLATAHASCKEDLLSRPVYKPLAESGLFDTLLVLQQDKSWHLERMDL